MATLKKFIIFTFHVDRHSVVVDPHTVLISTVLVLKGLPKMHVNVLVRNDDVAAYLVAGQAINKQGLIEYGGPARDVVSLAADSILRQRFEGQLPFVIYHVRKDLAQLIERENQATSPLECSKGRGCEMILHFRPDRLPAPLSERLFIWGLDFT